MTLSYTIRPGDTLSAIAARELGDAVQWPRLYRANSSVIRRERQRFAARRALIGPDHDWIFPGTVLVIAK